MIICRDNDDSLLPGREERLMRSTPEGADLVSTTIIAKTVAKRCSHERMRHIHQLRQLQIAPVGVSKKRAHAALRESAAILTRRTAPLWKRQVQPNRYAISMDIEQMDNSSSEQSCSSLICIIINIELNGLTQRGVTWKIFYVCVYMACP